MMLANISLLGILPILLSVGLNSKFSIFGKFGWVPNPEFEVLFFRPNPGRPISLKQNYELCIPNPPELSKNAKL